MTKGVIITGSRWGVLSDAATFPSWYFHEALKNRVDLEIWAEEVVEGTAPNVHSLRDSIPANISNRSGLLKSCLGVPAAADGFSPALIQACEEADFILIFFRGGNALTDLILRNWGRKTLLHLTDNLVLLYLRSRQFRYAFRALLEQFHCSRLSSRGVVFVSETDRKWFAKFFPWRVKDTHAIPLGVDTELFYPASETEISNRPGCTFLFTGDLSYAPNSEACRYLIERILPALPDDITMVFGGRRPPNFVTEAASTDKRIRVTGFITDLSAVYRDCDVMLVPIFHGAGMQNKLLEASASGLPCITTPVCAKAFPSRPPNFIIGHHADSLISQALALYKNPQHRRRLGQEGRSHMVREYSWAARAETLLRLTLR
jgi:glycosyltransferase involved in cell wall biosynthesis